MNKKDKVATKNNEINKKIEMENNHKALTNKLKEEIGDLEEFEDVTKYGEFISSYFAWTSLEKQKEKAQYFQDITNTKKGR